MSRLATQKGINERRQFFAVRINFLELNLSGKKNNDDKIDVFKS